MVGTNRSTLAGLVAEASAWDADFCEVAAQPQDLAFRGDGLVCNGRYFSLDQAARNRLYAIAGAPGWYLEKHSAEFQAKALQEHLDREEFGHSPRPVLCRGEVLTISDGGLIELGFRDVLKAVVEALGEESDYLFVTKIDRVGERLDVELVSASKEISVRVGDAVRGGLHIEHAPYRNQATVVEAFVYRLLCSNGMTRRECVSRDGITRTRKLPIDYPNGRELQLNQIRRLALQNWQNLQPQLQELRSTSERPTNVEALLTRWLQRVRISPRTMMPRLLAAWRDEGAENTHYGAVNALTHVATHDRELSGRQRRVLSSLGGLLAFSDVHLCPRCFSVLTNGTEHPEA